MSSEGVRSSLTTRDDIQSLDARNRTQESRNHDSLCATNRSSVSTDTPPAPSLSCLTRDARYARAEAALRLALSQCDFEPSPLELQVRVMEKGLHAWSARAGHGYERVRKAEEALATATAEGTRGSMSELQREKWMGMKERDEALEMVEKIKGLIAELNTEIRQGKTSPKSRGADPLPPRTSDEKLPRSTSSDTGSTKVPILFSGRLPTPYLQNLPRSRSSVEPLRLTQAMSRFTDVGTRPRSTTLRSEPGAITLSTPSTSRPSTPPPQTPTNGFGAALIHTPLPPKSKAQYLAEMEELEASGVGSRRVLSHVRLPSYVDNLLGEFSEDRIGGATFDLGKFDAALQTPPSTPLPEQGALLSPAAALSDTKSRSRGFLGRPFSTPSSVASTPSSRWREEGNRLATAARHPHLDSAAAFEKLLQTFSSAASASSASSSAPGSPALETSNLAPAPQHIGKSPRRMGSIVDSMRRGVKRVVRMGE